MKNISIDTSGKIDSSYIYAIKEIKKITDSQKIPFFIIGAFARDIIMEYCYGIKAPRRTMDIDLGIQVSNWDKFNKLTDSLKKSGKFETLNEKQRIIYKDIIIDIIPFGDISDKNERIIWPSDDIILSVLGFTEVYQNSTLVRLSNKPKLEVKIPTLPGLAILKLLAWKDDYPNRSKDAEDLLFIMKKYESAGIDEKLYNSELKILENEDFDNQIAGIVLLGKEMSKICSGKAHKYIKKIIHAETSEKSSFNLVQDMVNYSRDDFDRILYLLLKLGEGINYCI